MRVLITDNRFPDLDLELGIFREAGLDTITAQCRTEDELIAAGRDATAFLLQYAPANRKVFEALPGLRIVSRYGVGFDTINVADAAACGVWVANSPDYGVGEVATHAVAMSLSLVRHLTFYDRDIRAGGWHYLTPGVLRRPQSLVLGILGLGRIGKRMAHIARDAFSRVIACDPYIPETDFPPYVERVGLDALFSGADVVSVHTPLTDETRGLVGAALLARMGQGSYLVNTARGPIVDIDALLAALDSGRLAGAALDVLPQEPPGDHPIVRHPRVQLTPHSAFFSREAEFELRRKAARNIVTFARTGRPDYVVVAGTR